MRSLDAVGDAGALHALIDAAGWNQLPRDWERVMALPGAVCAGAEVDGRIVSTATVVTYGQELAWVGMVLTLPEYRQRGLARKVLEGVLALTRARSIKLDATEAGAPLYRSLGFVDEGEVARWKGMTDGAVVAADGQVDVALDARAFGVERRDVLMGVAADSEVYGEQRGFCCLRAGRVAAYLGPVVAEDASVAARLVRGALAGRGRVFWDIPAFNPPAEELARSLGFVPLRRLMRMKRGERHLPHEGNEKMMFGLAGFEYG